MLLIQDVAIEGCLGRQGEACSKLLYTVSTGQDQRDGKHLTPSSRLIGEIHCHLSMDEPLVYGSEKATSVTRLGRVDTHH